MVTLAIFVAPLVELLVFLYRLYELAPATADQLAVMVWQEAPVPEDRLRLGGDEGGVPALHVLGETVQESVQEEEVLAVEEQLPLEQDKCVPLTVVLEQ